MNKKKRIALVPTYLKEFTCIGSECEDTCCNGWQVHVDKATYKKYKKVTDPEIKPLLQKHVKRIRTNPNEHTYARLEFDENNNCQMLSEEKLCKIQLKLGEEYLSRVCMTYPRVSNTVNDILEKSLTTSCPEAARKILLNPDGIEFEEIEEDVKTVNAISRTIYTSNANHVHHYFWQLRVFIIQVLQNREYAINDRLIMLGFFFNKLHELAITNDLGKIPELIEVQSRYIQSGAYRTYLEKIPSKIGVQMSVLKKIIDHRFLMGVTNQRYLHCYQCFLEGIGFEEGKDVEELLNNYQEAYYNYFLPLMREHEYIFENYLVNYVYKNLVPAPRDGNIYHEYLLMVVHYGLIKMQLIGMAGFYKEQFCVDHVLMLMQSFAKMVEHNSLFLQSVIKTLEEHNYTSIAYTSVFVKN
jgi:lysine-N-methylase